MTVQTQALEGELHPIGQLSRCGVLDVGRKCPHSCVFCFYSFYDGSPDQFHYLRTAPNLDVDSLKGILDQFKAWGFTNFDYTGGEPSVHPQIVEVTEYAHKLGLRGRMISLGQFFQKKFRGSSKILLDELLEAGLHDFLLSVHTSDHELFKSLTGGRLQALLDTMDQLDERGFSYCTNTVVNEKNYHNLTDLAELFCRHQVRIANFIVMRMDWGLREQPGVALGTKGRYSDVMPHLKAAIDILDAAGIAVNVRYTPFCVLKSGYERHLVGYKGIELDPYEWRNGLLAASHGTPVLRAQDLDDYYNRRIMVYEEDPVYNLCYGPKCGSCALRPICDGVDKTYIETYGWDEFEPYAGEPIKDLCHFRHAYPGPFRMKTRQFDREPKAR